MKYNTKQMLICVSENGYLLQELLKLGYSGDGKYYNDLQGVNYRLEKELKRLFKRYNDNDDFIRDYIDAGTRVKGSNFFEHRSLSRTEAEKIADSQFELGESSKDDIFICLSHADSDKRRAAYKRLDRLSKLIVRIYLDNKTIEDAEYEIDYSIACLKAAKISK